MSEIIKLELVSQLLSEGRVEDAKAKFPQDVDVIDYFVSQDPSGNNKYLNWEMKMFKQLPPDAPTELKERHKELIANLIKGFHQHSQRLQLRDINQYKTLGDLNTAVSPLIKASEEKAVAKLEQEEGTKKLYEDSDWLLIVPLTHKTSCKYGANTQWCVASRDTSEHFKNYTKEGVLVFLIHKKSNNKFAFYTDISDNDVNNLETEIYNPIDNDISWDFGIDGSVKNFLDGLVDGDLETFLQDDGDYYDDDEEWTITWGPNNRRQHVWDEDELAGVVIDIILNHFLGRGSGRNSLQKYKRVFNVFGLTIEIQGKTQSSPFTVKDINGETVVDLGNTFFNTAAREGRINQILQDYLYDEFEYESMDNDSSLIQAVREAGLNINIEAPGSEPEKPPIDSDNIMTNEQSESILKAYDGYMNNITSEKRRKQEEKLNEILNSVSIENPEKYDICYDMNQLYRNLSDLPNTKAVFVNILRHLGLLKGRLPKNWPRPTDTLPNINPDGNLSRIRHLTQSCLPEMGRVRSMYHMPVTVVNPRNGRKSNKDLNNIMREISDIGVRIEDGYDGLFKMLLNREKTKQKNP